jgi:putative ABC transport system permease protein
MLHNWIKIAFSNYYKNWLTTLINLLGLSMGLTIFLLVFLNWQDEKSYEKWVPNKENIYFVELQTAKIIMSLISITHYYALLRKCFRR